MFFHKTVSISYDLCHFVGFLALSCWCVYETYSCICQQIWDRLVSLIFIIHHGTILWHKEHFWGKVANLGRSLALHPLWGPVNMYNWSWNLAKAFKYAHRVIFFTYCFQCCLEKVIFSSNFAMHYVEPIISKTKCWPIQNCFSSTMINKRIFSDTNFILSVKFYNKIPS